MKNLFVIIVCILPLLAGCSASKSEGVQKHLLWKVSDSNSSIYILGSVHLADSSIYPLDTVIEEAFNRSAELAVEIDMSDPSILQEIAVQTAGLGMLPDSMSLEKMLPDSLNNAIDSLCLLWGLPLNTFSRYKPWAATMTLLSLAIMRMGYDSDLGVDYHFLRRAHHTGKKIVSLETVEEQVWALTGEGVSDSLGIFYLKTSIQEMAELEAYVEKLMDAWKSGDDSLLAVAMEMESKEGNAADSSLQKQITDNIYTERNHRMAERLTAFLAEDRKIFVVVGAAHLAGKDDNVLDLLRRRGFTVEQL